MHFNVPVRFGSRYKESHVAPESQVVEPSPTQIKKNMAVHIISNLMVEFLK